MKKTTITTELRKLKDEMSDVRAALRQQLNIVADRLQAVERMVDSMRDRGRRIHDLEMEVNELKARPKKPKKRQKMRE